MLIETLAAKATKATKAIKAIKAAMADFAAQTPKVRKPESQKADGVKALKSHGFLGASFVDGKRQVRAAHLPAAHTARKVQ